MFKQIGRSLRNSFLVGLILVTPIAITAFIVQLLFNFTTNFLPKYLKDSEWSVLFRFLALLVVFMILCLIGLLVRNFIGKKIYNLGDR
ncbi:MAG: hypothetical protein V2A34_02785, partial [Lentisphaerota bacterium]